MKDLNNNNPAEVDHILNEYIKFTLDKVMPLCKNLTRQWKVGIFQKMDHWNNNLIHKNKVNKDD